MTMTQLKHLTAAFCLGILFVCAPAYAEEQATDETPPTEPASAEAASTQTSPSESPSTEAPSNAGQGPAEAGPPVRMPATANVLQLGVGFRYGVDLKDENVNPWGTGLGLDIGYTLPMAVYVGANFDYFFGESKDVLGIKTSANIWQLSAEGGYDFGIGPNFVIRPKVGVGMASVRAELCPDGTDCVSDSQTKLLVAPGATFALLTSSFSLSLDFRYDLVFADETMKGLIIAAGVGF
jgi:hypothetical protein